jgi:hypothetical protein
MIQDKRDIEIKSSPEIVFDLIEKMPNKFPIYKILETKPFFFLRLLLVDGLRSAIKAVSLEKPDDVLILKVGDSMGPFTLTESEKPFKYWFTLKSFFFNCRTGYSLSANGSMTTLSFILVSENPVLSEKVWWFIMRPFHGIFANKVLRNIKERVESQQYEHKSGIHHKKAYSDDEKNRAAD